MSVLLLRSDQRANVAAILQVFGWRATGRSWAKDDPQLGPVDAEHTHDQALVGLNFAHGWTVMHDTSVAFVDDTSVMPELARQLDTDGESRSEGSVLELVDRELGRPHDDVVLVDDVIVLEIERLK